MLSPRSSRTMHRYVILSLLFSAGLVQAQHRPEIGALELATEILHYDVEGTTPDEIAASLYEHSPSRDVPRFFGLTEWEVNADYRWVERDTGCTIEDATVRLVIRTHLPRWSHNRRSDAQVRRDWERFIVSLDTHERHHRVLIEEIGETLRWRLLSLREPDCSTMKQVSDRAVAEEIEAGTARNHAYDRETQHGRTQGATWPMREVEGH